MQSYKVIATFPHDTTSFTQGLVFASDGQLYESTGLQGESTLRRVDIATGQTLQRIDVPRAVFRRRPRDGRRRAAAADLAAQDSASSTTATTFKQKRTFPYKTEGWGIAYDGTSQPGDERRQRHADVPRSEIARGREDAAGAWTPAAPVGNLNELEWIEGEIWANVWMTDRIARISPNTGEVNAWIDLSSLFPAAQRMPPADVLNGIAYDKATRRIYITGKKWPRLYQITVG